MTVQRIYVEKKPEHAVAARGLLADLREQLGLPVTGVRIVNRYDIDGLDEATLAQVAPLVFFEPPLDDAYDALPVSDARVFAIEALPGQFDQRAASAAECAQLITQAERPIVAAATCYLLTGNLTDDDLQSAIDYVLNPVDSRLANLEPVTSLRPKVNEPAPVATIDGFALMNGNQLAELAASLGLAMTADDLAVVQANLSRDPTATELAVLDAYWSDHCRHTTFSTALDDITIDDPHVAAEWQQFLSTRKRTGAPTLMEVATAGKRAIELAGGTVLVDESEEINACTVPVTVDDDGTPTPWLLLFKNETHNHPTELEPFGGAATCIGGAIRDPLSGRGRIYQAMRVSGAGDPTAPVSETLPGKLPQRRLTQTAAAGFSSYGNQVGLATGMVHEIYHPGYVAKRLECGAVLAAVPAADVRREVPAPGDVVLLIGGRTGRDGIGGASGSSKAHEAASVAEWGAQVQKGDAPVERKLRRLFADPAVIRLIKRCNDFGAGGVCVAIGELADGVAVDLDAVPKKYDGLDGTELAVSESQERMAVVVSPPDADAMVELAKAENLEATPVAVITAEDRLTMTWRSQTIVDLPRSLMATGGAERHASAHISMLSEAIDASSGFQPAPSTQTPYSTHDQVATRPGQASAPSPARTGAPPAIPPLLRSATDRLTPTGEALGGRFSTSRGLGGIPVRSDRSAGLGGPPECREAVGCREASPPETPPATETPSTQHPTTQAFADMLTSLEFCNRQGLAERFDSTIGAGTVLMPFGGVRQRTPVQTMVGLLPTDGPTTTCSGMADGFNPWWTQRNPFDGAFLAVCDSVAKLVGAGFSRGSAYLSLQEYFPRLGTDAERWGQPLAALLGALKAQRLLGVAAIGGKDSMSGSFENLDVPPTLISFAVATGDVRRIVSPEFKRPGARLVAVGANPVDDPDVFLTTLDAVEKLTAAGTVESAWVCGAGGLAEALFLGAIGNGIGIDASPLVNTSNDVLDDLFQPRPGTMLLGLTDDANLAPLADLPVLEVGKTISDDVLVFGDERLPLEDLEAAWDEPLAGVFPRHSETSSRIPAGPEHTNRRGPRADELARMPRPRKVSRSEATNDAVLDARSGWVVTTAGVSAVASSNRLPPAIPPLLRSATDRLTPTGEVLGGRFSTRRGLGGVPVRSERSAGLGGPPESREAVGCRKASPPGTPPATETPSTQHSTTHTKPTAWIPVFPGNNCEDDTAKALRRAGANVNLQVINNLTPAAVAESARLAAANIAACQMVVIPGGFSGGDEPDGSAKLIASFMRGPAVADALMALLDDRDGLILGICNGFQALIKLGLVPFGRIVPAEPSSPTLTFNAIGRHQSMLVRTRVASTLSPWLAGSQVGDVHTVAVSHGEGRFVADDAQLGALAAAGQIAAQYVDLGNQPTMATPWNPNGSAGAVEALTSPDGRVLGKMGHTERAGKYLYRNVTAGDETANPYQPIFESGVAYFA